MNTLISLAALLALASAGLAYGLARRRRRAAGVADTSAVLIKHPAAKTLFIRGEMVISLPRQGEGLALNAVATRCWEMIDGSRSVRDIARAVASEYGVGVPEGLREVRTLVRRLKQDLLALEASEWALAHVHLQDVFGGREGGGIVEVRLSENLIAHVSECLRAPDGSIQPWRGTARQRRAAAAAMGAHRKREAHLETAARDFQNGWDHCDAGRLIEAESTLRRSVESAPDWAGAHYQLGYVCLRLKRHDEAIRSLERAEVISPGLHMVREYLDQARRLAAGDLSHEAFMLFDRATAAGLKDPDAVIRLARRALEITPGYPSAHLVLARAYEKKDQLDLALTELSRTLESNPDQATLCHALFSRGSIFMAQGRADKAMREWEKVIEINGSEAATRSALATIASTARAH